MWSTEIEYLLQESTNFLGCFALDMLPSFPKYLPSSLIVNTDSSKGVGVHWLSLLFLKNKCLYFDSFGLPIVEETLIKYIEPYYDSVLYSDVCIQDIRSTKCGKFCILFLTHVNSKSKYEKFLSRFNHINIKENDIMVENLMRLI